MTIEAGHYVPKRGFTKTARMRSRWVLGVIGGKVRYSNGHRHSMCTEKTMERWIARTGAILKTSADCDDPFSTGGA